MDSLQRCPDIAQTGPLRLIFGSPISGGFDLVIRAFHACVSKFDFQLTSVPQVRSSGATPLCVCRFLKLSFVVSSALASPAPCFPCGSPVRWVLEGVTGLTKVPFSSEGMLALLSNLTRDLIAYPLLTRLYYTTAGRSIDPSIFTWASLSFYFTIFQLTFAIFVCLSPLIRRMSDGGGGSTHGRAARPFLCHVRPFPSSWRARSATASSLLISVAF